MTKENRTNEARQHERHDTGLSATIIHEGQSFVCQMVNVSVSGARVHIDQRFPPGMNLTMTIYPFGEFACRIIWQKDHSMGVRFLESEEMMVGVIQAMVVL